MIAPWPPDVPPPAQAPCPATFVCCVSAAPPCALDPLDAGNVWCWMLPLRYPAREQGHLCSSPLDVCAPPTPTIAKPWRAARAHRHVELTPEQGEALMARLRASPPPATRNRIVYRYAPPEAREPVAAGAWMAEVERRGR